MVNVALVIAAAAALGAGVCSPRSGAAATGRGAIARAVLAEPADHTTMDARGAVRSVQAAELTLPAAALAELWSPMHLERLARTYWRFLSRCTLGLIRVKYDDDERAVVFLTRPFVLLRFHAPEYEMDARARRRALADRQRRARLARRRTAATATCRSRSSAARRSTAETARVHVEVEVANFYPALASAVARWFYSATQSRIHVIVTHGFLRSLARLDLAESVVGRYAAPDDVDAVPDPPARAPRAAARPDRAAARPPRTAGTAVACVPRRVARARASVRRAATPGACGAR